MKKSYDYRICDICKARMTEEEAKMPHYYHIALHQSKGDRAFDPMLAQYVDLCCDCFAKIDDLVKGVRTE